MFPKKVLDGDKNQKWQKNRIFGQKQQILRKNDFLQKFLTVNFVLSFETCWSKKFKKQSIIFFNTSLKIINLWGKKFFYWKWELDSANNRRHKLGFSAPLPMNMLVSILEVRVGVCAKKKFVFRKVLWWLFKKQKNILRKLNFSWKKLSLNFANFQKKIAFRNFFQQKQLLLSKNRST